MHKILTSNILTGLWIYNFKLGLQNLMTWSFHLGKTQRLCFLVDRESVQIVSKISCNALLLL